MQVVFGICIFDVEFGARLGRHKSSFSFWHLYLVLYMEHIVGCTEEVLYLAFVFGAVSRAHCGLRTKEEAL